MVPDSPSPPAPGRGGIRRVGRLLAGTAAGVVLLAGLAWLAGELLRDRDPVYAGATAFEWAEVAGNGAPEARAAALEMARNQVIPDLIHRLDTDTNDSPALLWMAEALSRLPGLEVRRTPASGRRNQAVQELALFGTNAAPAIPRLVGYLRDADEDLAGSAAEVLPRLGADPDVVVPLLLAQLTDAGGHGRPVMVEALGAYGPRAKAAVPALLRLLGDRSSKEILWAVPRALKSIDPRAAAEAGVR